MSSTEVSHGRGGAGNMRPDDTEYVDGSIVRAGPEGSHGDGAYSSGRGGAGNIGDVGTVSMERSDSDMIPDVARRSEDVNHHTGRGGAGNEQHVAPETKEEPVKEAPKDTAPKGLADKLKAKLFGKKK